MIKKYRANICGEICKPSRYAGPSEPSSVLVRKRCATDQACSPTARFQLSIFQSPCPIRAMNHNRILFVIVNESNGWCLSLPRCCIYTRCPAVGRDWSKSGNHFSFYRSLLDPVTSPDLIEDRNSVSGGRACSCIDANGCQA